MGARPKYTPLDITADIKAGNMTVDDKDRNAAPITHPESEDIERTSVKCEEIEEYLEGQIDEEVKCSHSLDAYSGGELETKQQQRSKASEYNIFVKAHKRPKRRTR